jgi:Protein of unknown function (DUF1207)
MTSPTRVVVAVILSVWATCTFAASPAEEPVNRDAFIAGYASAILEHDFHLEPTAVTVKDGFVTVTSHELGAAEKENIRQSLMKIQGVLGVHFEDQVLHPSAREQVNIPTSAPEGGGVRTLLSPHPWTFLAPTSVFDPLIADPRWPDFSAAYVRYIGHAQNDQPGQTNRDAGDVSFGDSLSLFQWAPNPSGTLEIGVQAALFADFDLDQKNVDLINADYFVGPVAEYRMGDFSMLLRIFHQSSHLGDNFLLNNPGITRFELSYEEPDVLFSCDLFHKSLRFYGGGGYLVDVDPSSLKPGVVEYGLEYYGPPIFNNSSTIPVAAIDIQNRQQNNWSKDISARVGLEFQNPSTFGRRLDLMLEYYNGHSPNGQFFLQKIQSLGIGLHFYL